VLTANTKLAVSCPWNVHISNVCCNRWSVNVIRCY
jgi:hypothetical protein